MHEGKTETKVITPRQFAAEMKRIAAREDAESSHGEADKLLCSVLTQLGYKTGVTIFNKMKKWYG
jgi:hypothetical protein